MAESRYFWIPVIHFIPFILFEAVYNDCTANYYFFAGGTDCGAARLSITVVALGIEVILILLRVGSSFARPPDE